jgi:ubiquinone/menaquinone biosynthesis C-methylase UbiE
MIEEPHGRILDVGAGTGKLSLPLMRQSRQVISLDSSSEMLRIARSRAKEEGMSLKSVVCDAHELCFGDETFECVVASRLLMHLADWKRGIAELCRVAKGAVAVDFPPLRSFAGVEVLFTQCRRFFHADTEVRRAFLIRSVINELRRHNFRLVELKSQFFLPIAIHRRLNSPLLSSRIEKLCRRLGLVKLFGAPVSLIAIRKRPGNAEAWQERSLG